MTDPREAAEIWVERYADQVFRLAYALTGERTRAEDASQDSLYHIARWCLSHPDFTPTDAWVYQVTRNAVRDLVRRLAPPTVPWEDYQSAHEDQTADDRQAERLDVARALRRLSNSDREVLVFFYYLDLSTKEIAAVMKVSETAVRIRLTRARARFRQVFDTGHGEGKERSHDHT